MTKQIPQGYKQTKVGIIPEDWEVVKLGDLLKSKPKYGINAPAVDYNRNLPAYLRITDIDDNGKFISGKKASVDDPDYANYILEDNDLVFARTGATVGKSYLYNKNDGILVFAGFLIKISPNQKKLNAIFLKSYVNSYPYWKWITLMSARSGQPGVNAEEYFSLPLPYPSLKEQEKIAEILSTWDDAITKQEQLIEQKQVFKKGIMQQIFSQKIRFWDDNGTDYPAWEEKKLGTLNIYIADGNYGEMYPKSNELLSEGVPFIRANNFQNLRLMWNDMKFISPLLHKKLISGHIKTHDILVTTRGDIGMLSYVTKDFSNSNINAQICLLRCISGVFSKYLLYFLSSSYGVTQFKALQTGSALKQLPKGNLSKLFIKLPCLEEQTKIADFLTIIDEEIEKLSEELGQMKLQKQGLMQRLLTGSVRVVI